MTLTITFLQLTSLLQVPECFKNVNFTSISLSVIFLEQMKTVLIYVLDSYSIMADVIKV